MVCCCFEEMALASIKAYLALWYNRGSLDFCLSQTNLKCTFTLNLSNLKKLSLKVKCDNWRYNSPFI